MNMTDKEIRELLHVVYQEFLELLDKDEEQFDKTWLGAEIERAITALKMRELRAASDNGKNTDNLFYIMHAIAILSGLALAWILALVTL